MYVRYKTVIISRLEGLHIVICVILGAQTTAGKHFSAQGALQLRGSLLNDDFQLSEASLKLQNQLFSACFS